MPISNGLMIFQSGKILSKILDMLIPSYLVLNVKNNE